MSHDRLETMFQLKVKQVKSLTEKPTDDELLELYGLYKQAIEGDNQTSTPSFYKLKEKAKWKAWNEKKGLNQETAKQRYVDLVNHLEDIYGTK